MSLSSNPAGPAKGRSIVRAAQVIIVSSVMFSFISHWRAAAVVLCDMSSTAYYIGTIVENAIGKAAPWFIVAVLFFAYAVATMYIESSALFVRGGVYRVVKEAMGGFLAKLSVSALLFDYILTGPISSVTAGQYVIGLAFEAITRYAGIEIDETTRQNVKSWGSVLIACSITLYFFRQNLIGLHESSGKALKIMLATAVMAVIVLGWSGLTLATRGPVNDLPDWRPDLHKKVELDEAGQPTPKLNPITGEQEDPLGFLGAVPALADPIRDPGSWLSILGVIGIIIAFGHSILAMSGEETLAQVYREVESPKLPNFKKAAFTVFFFSLLLTGSVSILAMLLVPDEMRVKDYADNLIGGLAMHLAGPVWARLALNAFVVIVGFLILSGAVNTSIIGSNGVLNRVAEDGVVSDWVLKPHRRYGTTSRILYLVTGLQMVTIIASHGDVILLGEAYAFGVVWSFVFKTLSMVVLRFKDRSPREFKVPFNFRIGSVEVPVGLLLIFLVVFLAAIANLLTKQVATISGLAFTSAFLTVFMVTEHLHEKRRRGAKHEHIEQFNQQTAGAVTHESLGLSGHYRKLVAIRSPQNLFMLEKALQETDPTTTDVVVMTAKLAPVGDESPADQVKLDAYDQQLMTAVVERAEKAGKTVHPLITPTNNPLHAVLKAAKDLQVQELVMGVSNKFSAEEQLDQISFYWISLHDGPPPGLTVRILSQDRDVSFDLHGGNRIPKAGERKARSVGELRAAGVGIDRVLLVHDGTLAGSDLFQSVLTMLDDEVRLDIVAFVAGQDVVDKDQEKASDLKRDVEVHLVEREPGSEIVRIAREGRYDLVILPTRHIADVRDAEADMSDYVLKHAHCPVFVATPPRIPDEVEEHVRA